MKTPGGDRGRSRRHGPVAVAAVAPGRRTSKLLAMRRRAVALLRSRMPRLCQSVQLCSVPRGSVVDPPAPPAYPCGVFRVLSAWLAPERCVATVTTHFGFCVAACRTGPARRPVVCFAAVVELTSPAGTEASDDGQVWHSCGTLADALQPAEPLNPSTNTPEAATALAIVCNSETTIGLALLDLLPECGTSGATRLPKGRGVAPTSAALRQRRGRRHGGSRCGDGGEVGEDRAKSDHVGNGGQQLQLQQLHSALGDDLDGAAPHHQAQRPWRHPRKRLRKRKRLPRPFQPSLPDASDTWEMPSSLSQDEYSGPVSQTLEQQQQQQQLHQLHQQTPSMVMSMTTSKNSSADTWPSKDSAFFTCSAGERADDLAAGTALTADSGQSAETIGPAADETRGRSGTRRLHGCLALTERLRALLTAGPLAGPTTSAAAVDQRTVRVHDLLSQAAQLLATTAAGSAECRSVDTLSCVDLAEDHLAMGDTGDCGSVRLSKKPFLRKSGLLRRPRLLRLLATRKAAPSQ